MVAKTKADASKNLIAQALKGDKAAGAEKKVAGNWGTEKYNDGYVTGLQLGNTVYVQKADDISFGARLRVSKKLNPNINFVVDTKK